MYNCQLELVGTGICRGKIDVTTEQLAEKDWYKYKVNGERLDSKLRTSSDEIYKRLGVMVRPRVSEEQNHVSLFNDAFLEARKNALARGFNVDGNIKVLYAGSTTEQRKIPSYLEDVCRFVGLNQNHHREFVAQACASFNNGVSRLSQYVEENPFDGYAVVGVSEILSKEWAPDNFDLMLFGDIGGAAIFKVTPKKVDFSSRKILGCYNLHIPDERGDIVRLEDGYLYMDGKAVIELAPREMVNACLKSIEKAGLSVRDISKFITHSGSAHILRQIQKMLRRFYGEDLVIEQQVPSYLDDSGNNGGATTLNVLHRQIIEGKINNKDKIAVSALGKGNYISSFIINGFSW